MADTFTTVWQRLKARASAVDSLLLQDMVRDAFNQLSERREWSWRRKHSSWYPSIFYNTGTVSATPGSNVITGVGTTWLASFVGSQFRLGTPSANYPTYTIAQFVSATSLVLDQPWVGPVVTGAGYQIFQCYMTVPSDFQSFYLIVNITNNYRLCHNLTEAELDLADPQRVMAGTTYAVAFYDYTQNTQGLVAPSLQIIGSGAVPVSGTTLGYSYPANSVYTVQIVGGGASGVATYKWKQDTGAFSAPIVTGTSAQNLSFGVQVQFPTGTYVANDIFIIQAFSDTVSGLPRYELWPRPINTPFVYPFIYKALLPDLSDTSPTLPPFIAERGDVLLEMCLKRCAEWPGTETMRNPYYDLTLAQRHHAWSETLIYELEKYDDDTAAADFGWQNMNYAGPFLDGSFLQTHGPLWAGWGTGG